VQRVKAEPDEILMVDLPEWRIVEDEVWFAVQEQFTRRTDAPGERKRPTRTAKEFLSGAVLENVLAEVRREVEAQMPKRDVDIAALEAELAEARAEQRKLARAVALADDIPELVSELRQRSARIQHLEVQVAAARQTPEEIAALIANVEATCRARLKDLRAALSDPGDLRDVFLAFFPEGLTFTAEVVPPQSG
jgi:hypothetical protein